MEKKKYKVLLIEDDELEQTAFKRFVENNSIPYDCFIVGSVSEAKRLLVTEKFDVIICIEVLEHLFDPLSVLRKIVDALADAGELYISLPNEFHLIRRLEILVGRQDFSRYDWHHLRFFDKQEAERLISDAGLKITAKTYLPLAPPRMQWLTGLGRFLSTLWPTLFASSFIYKTTRR